MSTKTMTIGADPEFGFLKDGTLVIPNTVISGGGGGEFGIDGAGSVAELRPPHDDNPRGLVNNIQKVLAAGYKTHEGSQKLFWKAGDMAADHPIGGHIHFGSPKLISNEMLRINVTTALDRTVALVALMVAEPEEALNRRRGSGYGGVGNSRQQSWGMEYRVLGSWLTSPEEALAICSLAYLVAQYHEDKDIMDEACSLPAYNSNAFAECDKLQLLYYLPPIVDFLTKLPDWKKYEKDIIPIFRLIKARKLWAYDKNMVESWNVAEAASVKKAKKAEVYV